MYSQIFTSFIERQMLKKHYRLCNLTNGPYKVSLDFNLWFLYFENYLKTRLSPNVLTGISQPSSGRSFPIFNWPHHHSILKVTTPKLGIDFTSTPPQKGGKKCCNEKSQICKNRLKMSFFRLHFHPKPASLDQNCLYSLTLPCR